jgi:hypothetical protein
MRRLFEFEDLDWFPNVVRHGGTDFLRFFFTASKFYQPVVPLLSDLLRNSGERKILDLCSGSGGSMSLVKKDIERLLGENLIVTLSDKFPQQQSQRNSIHDRMEYHHKSIDVLLDVPPTEGVRTMFTAIHHFNETQVSSILQNASSSGKPVAIFDGADKNVFTFLAIPLFQPLLFAVCTPFIRPFKVSRLLLTYAVPLIPVMTIWDGMVSVTRLHQHSKLLVLAKKAVPHYEWKAGLIRNRLGLRISYLIGVKK